MSARPRKKYPRWVPVSTVCIPGRYATLIDEDDLEIRDLTKYVDGKKCILEPVADAVLLFNSDKALRDAFGGCHRFFHEVVLPAHIFAMGQREGLADERDERKLRRIMRRAPL